MFLFQRKGRLLHEKQNVSTHYVTFSSEFLLYSTNEISWSEHFKKAEHFAF